VYICPLDKINKNIMEVTVFNTQLGRWIDYDVSTTANTPKGISFYSRDEDGYYSPTYREEFIVKKVKPSIYQRPIFRCKADEYKYQYTEKKTKTVTTESDIYYNDRRDRFITRTKSNTNVRTIYTW
jgi:hypothetical protein